MYGHFVDDKEWGKVDKDTAPIDDDDGPTFHELQFKNRVRGRPELVQFMNDRIYYSGNRGRPDRWVCEWPPHENQQVCRFDGQLYEIGQAKTMPWLCYKDKLDEKKWAEYSQGYHNKKSWEKGWCMDGSAMLWTDSKDRKGGAEGFEHQCGIMPEYAKAYYGRIGKSETRLLCKPAGWRCEWPPQATDSNGLNSYCGSYGGGMNPPSSVCANGCHTEKDTWNGISCKQDGGLGTSLGTGAYKDLDPMPAARYRPATYETDGCMDARDHGCYWDCSGVVQAGCFWNCIDLEYEFDTRKEYMSYDNHYALHALDKDSAGLKGLTARVRMSGREIFTYGSRYTVAELNGGIGEDTECEAPGADGKCDVGKDRKMDATFFQTMLPCRGGRGVERACFNMKATKIEYLIGAMYQSFAYPNSELLYGVFPSSGERGSKQYHPANLFWSNRANQKYNTRPSALTDPPHHHVHGPKFLAKTDRVYLWDIDQTFDFDVEDFKYYGANFKSHHYKNFKSILYNEKVCKPNSDTEDACEAFPYAQFQNWDDHAGRMRDLTRWGTSDGTSRTNVHAISCWVDNPLQENVYSAGKWLGNHVNRAQEGKTTVWGSIDWIVGFARRACLGHNGDDGYYTSYSAKPSAWPWNYGFMRSVETIPMTMNSVGYHETDMYRHYHGEGNVGDWGVMGVPVKHDQNAPYYFGKMAVACNYNDLFATRKEQMWDDRYRYEYIGFDRDSPYGSPNLSGETPGQKDNSYADLMYFFDIQGPQTLGHLMIRYNDKYSFSGSRTGCCANSPIIKNQEDGTNHNRDHGYDKCGGSRSCFRGHAWQMI